MTNEYIERADGSGYDVIEVEVTDDEIREFWEASALRHLKLY
jgi:hypothetical protein